MPQALPGGEALLGLPEDASRPGDKLLLRLLAVAAEGGEGRSAPSQSCEVQVEIAWLC